MLCFPFVLSGFFALPDNQTHMHIVSSALTLRWRESSVCFRRFLSFVSFTRLCSLRFALRPGQDVLMHPTAPLQPAQHSLFFPPIGSSSSPESLLPPSSLPPAPPQRPQHRHSKPVEDALELLRRLADQVERRADRGGEGSDEGGNEVSTTSVLYVSAQLTAYSCRVSSATSSGRGGFIPPRRTEFASSPRKTRTHPRLDSNRRPQSSVGRASSRLADVERCRRLFTASAPREQRRRRRHEGCERMRRCRSSAVRAGLTGRGGGRTLCALMRSFFTFLRTPCSVSVLDAAI